MPVGGATIATIFLPLISSRGTPGGEKNARISSHPLRRKGLRQTQYRRNIVALSSRSRKNKCKYRRAGKKPARISSRRRYCVPTSSRLRIRGRDDCDDISPPDIVTQPSRRRQKMHDIVTPVVPQRFAEIEYRHDIVTISSRRRKISTKYRHRGIDFVTIPSR